ncbi:hypothetical protein L6452_42494 [Arctium lappa]|uniref:Uncharacterized protein n=1 Tax=Arctium lappa TaxID=4217 RepID=A0ACB8XIC7_ARCLA|nr:hypothetical protein L6452_42494 [Arctium lappa]
MTTTTTMVVSTPTLVVTVLVSTMTLVVTVLVSSTTLVECQHIEVWVRLHLESRSTLADWSIMLPDFMYYMTELKDLSYLTQQCNGAQGSAGFPAWGTINKANIADLAHLRHCGPGAPPPERL